MASNIVYVTRDRERAQGMPEGEGYSIISGDGSKSTPELLADPKTLETIHQKKASVVVFKNNSQIEELARGHGLKLLNPRAELAEKIENKITQVAWLGELAKLLPPHQITLVKNVQWNKKPFILQWAHSHTGDGTLLIQDEKELNNLKSKFPEREVRITDFIRGPIFTLNVVPTENTVLLGNVSYQITGTLPFTDNPFSTVGNDWSLPHSILTETQIEEIQNIAHKIGDQMRGAGWRGLFGIDVIYDEESGIIHLLEINARQPASTTLESQLQSRGIRGVTSAAKGGDTSYSSELTIFEAHLLALTGEPITSSIILINDGAQIVQRVTKKQAKVDVEALTSRGYNCINYPNVKMNADLVRIQSDRGIMEAHNKFNKRGEEILEVIK